MPFRYFLVLFFVMGTVISTSGEELQIVPEPLYPELEYLFSLTNSEDAFQPDQVAGLVDFVRTVTVGSSSKLTIRNGISGAFFSFSYRRDR